MKRFALPVLARYGSIAVQLFVVLAATRTLSIDDAGAYFSVSGIVLTTYFLAGVGLPDGLVKTAPGLFAQGQLGHASFQLRRGVLISVATLPIGGFLCATAVGLLWSDFTTALLAGCWWIAYGAILVGSQAIVALGHGAVGAGIFYSAANLGLAVVLLPASLVVGHFTLNELLSISAIAVGAMGAATLIYSFARVQRETERETVRTSLRDAWKQGALIAVGRAVQAALIWSPVWVAGVFLGAADAALVGLASRLMSAAAALIASIRFSVRPELSRLAALDRWHEIGALSSRIAFVATAFALGLAVLVGASGWLALPALFGPEYRGSGLVLLLLLIATLGESFGGPVDEVLRMSGRAGFVLATQAAALVAGVIAECAAAALGGVLAVSLIYGLVFIAMYAVMVGAVYRQRGVLIAPRWPRRAGER